MTAFSRGRIKSGTRSKGPLCRTMLEVGGTDNDGGGSDFATTGGPSEVGTVLISFFAVLSTIAVNDSAITRAVVTGIRTRRPALRLGEVSAIALCSRPNGNGVGCE